MDSTNSKLPKPFFDKAFEHFWYDEQCVNYITQFMAVFAGMYIKVGKNDYCSETDLVEVPIRYSGGDRIVDAILADNTQNVPLSLPMFSARLAEIQQEPGRAKGTGTIFRKSILPLGQSLPDGVRVVSSVTPYPYSLVFELSLFTSNDLQKFQIMEQILSLFNPSIQIQTSDATFDGAKFSNLTLSTISFDDNYPAGTSRRFNMSTMIFVMDAWMYTPINFRDNFIKSIHLKLSNVNSNATYDDILSGNIFAEQIADYTTSVDDMDFPQNE